MTAMHIAPYTSNDHKEHEKAELLIERLKRRQAFETICLNIHNR